MGMPTGEYKLPPLSDFTVKEVFPHNNEPTILFRQWLHEYYTTNQGEIPSYAYDNKTCTTYIYRPHKPAGVHIVDEDQYEIIYVDDDPQNHVS